MANERTESEAREVDPNGSTPKAVVAIGASAGGLDALRRFLAGLAPDLDAALVVAQHLSPVHASSLVELLAKGSPLAVVEAVHGAIVARGVVYVTPPDHDVVFRDERIELSLNRPGFDRGFVLTRLASAGLAAERTLSLLMGAT